MNPFQIGFKLTGNPLGKSGHTAGDFSMKFDHNMMDCVRHFTCDAQLGLIPGEHAVNATGRSAEFGVAPDTSARLHVTVREHDGELVLDHLELEFSKPMRLLNIFTTIDELSALLASTPAKQDNQEKQDDEDGFSKNEVLSKASAFIGSNAKILETNAKKYANIISNTNAWKFFKDAAERGHIAENFEKSKEYSKELFEKGKESAESVLDKALQSVELSKLEIQIVNPEGKSGNLPLKFYISGQVVLNSRLKRTFERYPVPDMFLPNFDAHLDRLLGQFCVDREQGGNLSRTAIHMLSDITGTVNLEMKLAPIPFQFGIHEGWSIETNIHSHESIHCQASCEIRRIEQSQTIFNVSSRAKLTGDHMPESPIHIDFQATPEDIVEFGQSLGNFWTLSMIGHGQKIIGRFELERGCAFYADHVDLAIRHPLLRDETSLSMVPGLIPFSGIVDWGVDISSHTLHIHTFDLNVSGKCHADAEHPVHFHGIQNDCYQLECEINTHATRKIDGKTLVCTDFQASFDILSHFTHHAIPEFGLNSSQVEGHSIGKINARLPLHMDNIGDEMPYIDMDGASINILCTAFDLTWDQLSVAMQHPAHIHTIIRHAMFSIAGLSDCNLGISWNFESSPSLIYQDNQAALLPADACIGTIDATLSESGILEFQNGTGFYNAKFFNTLLQPNTEREHWLEILKHDEIYQHLMQIGKATIFPKIQGSEAFCLHMMDWVHQCEQLDLFSISKAIHPQNLARILSLLLFNDESAADEILPSIQKAYHAEGIDRFKIEELLERAFPNANLDNAGRILKWVHHLFMPVPYTAPIKTHHPALCDDPRLLDQIVILPTANELYDADWYHSDIASRCYTYAAGFTAEQLDWVIDNRIEHFEPQQTIKLKVLRDIKYKIRNLEPREGTFIVQDFNIEILLNTLLNEEIACYRGICRNGKDQDIADCYKTWLAPCDIAHLISAGISSRFHGLFVQLNQALLFQYLQMRGRIYARAVFYEIGMHSTRVLVSMLMSWLAQDQSLMLNPVDRAQELMDLLGVDIPKGHDYTPWGAMPASSYIDAIFDAAESINQLNETYSASCLRMQSYRIATLDAPSTPNTPKAELPGCLLLNGCPELARDMALAIQSADAQTAPLVKGAQDIDNISSLSPETVENARQAWAKVFKCAQKFAKNSPEPWKNNDYKLLWSRAYEALRIHSVEDDVLRDYDETRRWLAYHANLSIDELCSLPYVQRIKLIIDNIYIMDNDRKEILHDPLTWFMPEIPEGNLDLTIVTSMGIITNGAGGHEFETVFERLRKQRNIRVIRSNTGTIQPLDYNADRIIQSISQTQSPYVMIGYSQGCPNMMRAESRLCAGTPEQQALLDRLVSRNFICSAFNGTPHAICGVQKYRNLLVEGESVIKTFSVSLSTTLSSLLLAVVQRILDTSLITASLASVEAISHEGLTELSRDAQYCTHAVSLETSGTTQRFPEALVIMASNFDKQANIANDSQVGIDCAHGYPVYNENDSVNVLYKETIPAKLLNIHHWSPVIDEVRFIESEQDIEQCLYKGPKSMFVTPWIDSLILFGQLGIA